jgi:hypothetical protein
LAALENEKFATIHVMRVKGEHLGLTGSGRGVDRLGTRTHPRPRGHAYRNPGLLITGRATPLFRLAR